MNVKFSITPNKLTETLRYTAAPEGALPITLAYIDRYTYSWNTHIDTGAEFTVGDNKLFHNVHIGSFCSIAENLNIFVGRSHNIKAVSTGAVHLLANELGYEIPISNSTFNQKSSVIIQNDVWIGDNVTIMPNVIIHNGACIAKNSHVINDVPPYAIVGGNPAKILGYRFTPSQIQKLLNLQWWYWDMDIIKERFSYFNENIDAFCDSFEHESLADVYQIMRDSKESHHYFAFVDYYENYASYPNIINSFLANYSSNPEYKLTLFIQDEYINVSNNASTIIDTLTKMVDYISNNQNIKCSVELLHGDKDISLQTFSTASHYITSRTYDTVFFTTLADMTDKIIISGSDSLIQYEKTYNMYKK